MNRISRLMHVNATPMRAASQDVTLSHGPRQLTWLRRSIEAFRHAEQQRVQLRLDVVRAARLAGLIQVCEAGQL